MKTKQLLFLLPAIFLLATSCSKENKSLGNAERQKLSLSFIGVLDGFENDTKAYANTDYIETVWQGKNETVYVYDESEFLGTLTTSLLNNNPHSVRISGEVDFPSDQSASVLTFVYSPFYAGEGIGSLFDATHEIVIDLSTQEGSNVPFVAYATMNLPSRGEESEAIKKNSESVTFKLATSIVNVSCTGLQPGQQTLEYTLDNVSTACCLAMDNYGAPAASGKETGIIRKKLNVDVNDEGEAFVQFAVPVQTVASKPRTITLYQNGIQYYDDKFPTEKIKKNELKSVTCQLVKREFDSEKKIQLWEDGPYWAGSNVGANYAEEAGWYFTYGNIEGYLPEVTGETGSSDVLGSFEFCKWVQASNPGAGTELQGGFTAANYQNTPGSLLNQPWTQSQASVNDAATVNMGEDWRTPTAQDVADLFSKANVEGPVELNGVKGYKFSNKQDSSKSIFIPVTGSGYEDKYLLYHVGSNASYCRLNSFSAGAACVFSPAYPSGAMINELIPRFAGCTLRAVSGANVSSVNDIDTWKESDKGDVMLK